MKTLKTLPWLALVACAAPTAEPDTSSASSALTTVVANGSFETGDYAGWTLAEDSGVPSFGTWAIVSENQTIGQSENVFDFFDQTFVTEFSPGLPITYHATDGAFLAAQLQNGGENHRMFQTVALPSCQPLLLWDMQYRNHFGNGFDPFNQYLAINVRDPNTDAVLATPFKTNPGDPIAIGMTPFQVDLTPFAGQTVRIDFEQQVRMFFFDAAYDNVRVVCKGLGAFPGTLDFGAVDLGNLSAPKVATIQNFANVPLTMSSLTVDGPFLLLSAPPLPLTLQPGESSQLQLAFSSSQLGTSLGAVTIQSDDPNGPTTIALTGTGTLPQVPRIVVQPPAVDFGTVRPGPLVLRQVQISNAGGNDLILTSLAATPPFSITGSVPPIVPAGTSVDLTVALVATGPGPLLGVLTIGSNDLATPFVTVSLAALVVEPAIAVQPGSLAFGLQRVATTSPPQTVTIANVGTDTMTIASVTANGPFVAGPVSNPVLPPGAVATVDVQFVPFVAGATAGALTIVSDAPGSPTLVFLTGTGTEPILGTNVPPIDFGTVRVGTTRTKAFTVANIGTAPMAILSVNAISNPPYSIASIAPRTVLPGAQATVTVVFAPQANVQADSFAIVTTDGGSIAVSLTGIGIQPFIATNPPSIDFGDVRIGTSSGARSAAIANPGNAPLVVTSIAFPPGIAPTQPIGIPATIAANSALAFDVVFAPKSHATLSSSIAIASDAGPAAIAVTGRGVAPSLAASLPQLDFGAVAIGAESSLDVQLTNTGDAPATIASAAIAGPDYTLTSSPPSTLAAGASATLTVRFVPSDHGVRSAQFVIASDANPIAVALVGTGGGPRAVFTAFALDFGAANVATAAPGRSVTVTNTGDADLAISAIVIAGASATDFATTTSVPATVTPGASATFAFTFTPSAVGSRAATATFATTDPLVPSTTLAFAGIGTSPAMALAPIDIDFGGVNIGTSRAIPVTITNTGSGPLTLASIAVAGADAAAFTLAPSALPIALAPSKTATLQATFAPAVIGTATAAITIVSDDPSVPLATVTLAGLGTAPTVAVTPADIDFGAQVVGHPSALRQIHVANQGSGPLAVTALAITGAQASQFALVSPPALPFAIPAGGELVVSLRVTTSASAVAAADLQITTDAAAATISLAGLGIAAGLSVSPATVDFGTTHPGMPPAPITVTLTNLTAEPIDLVEAIRGGANPGLFAVSSVAGTLAAGASATAVVEYTALVPGASAASLTFAATDSTIPHAVLAVTAKAVSTYITTPRDTIDFGPIAVGEASGAKTVAITNVTTAPVSIASVTSADPQFAVTAPPTDPIAPGATVVVTVAFAPEAPGPASSTIAITLAGATSPELVVAVTGTGEASDGNGGCSAGGSSPLCLGLVLVALLRYRRRRPVAAS